MGFVRRWNLNLWTTNAIMSDLTKEQYENIIYNFDPNDYTDETADAALSKAINKIKVKNKKTRNKGIHKSNKKRQSDDKSSRHRGRRRRAGSSLSRRRAKTARLHTEEIQREELLNYHGLLNTNDEHAADAQQDQGAGLIDYVAGTVQFPHDHSQVEVMSSDEEEANDNNEAERQQIESQQPEEWQSGVGADGQKEFLLNHTDYYQINGSSQSEEEWDAQGKFECGRDSNFPNDSAECDRARRKEKNQHLPQALNDMAKVQSPAAILAHDSAASPSHTINAFQIFQFINGVPINAIAQMDDSTRAQTNEEIRQSLNQARCEEDKINNFVPNVRRTFAAPRNSINETFCRRRGKVTLARKRWKKDILSPKLFKELPKHAMYAIDWRRHLDKASLSADPPGEVINSFTARHARKITSSL